MSTEREFEIDSRRVVRYFRYRSLPFLIILVALSLTLIDSYIDSPSLSRLIAWSPLLLMWILYFSYIIVYAPRQIRALKYWLEPGTLRIDEGIMMLKKKSIPLDRITDVVLVQGPMMRLAGIWSLQVQTAGSTRQGPEGLLYGIIAPETVRDTIMEERETILGKRSRDIET